MPTLGMHPLAVVQPLTRKWSAADANNKLNKALKVRPAVILLVKTPGSGIRRIVRELRELRLNTMLRPVNKVCNLYRDSSLLFTRSIEINGLKGDIVKSLAAVDLLNRHRSDRELEKSE